MAVQWSFSICCMDTVCWKSRGFACSFWEAAARRLEENLKSNVDQNFEFDSFSKVIMNQRLSSKNKKSSRKSCKFKAFSAVCVTARQNSTNPNSYFKYSSTNPHRIFLLFTITYYFRKILIKVKWSEKWISKKIHSCEWGFFVCMTKSCFWGDFRECVVR